MILRKILIVLSIMGVLTALFCGAERWRVERRNRRVDLTVDMEEIKRLADGTGRPLPALLQQFKAAGITSVAITEDTVASLRDQGLLSLAPADMIAATFPELHTRETTRRSDDLFVVTSSSEICGRIRLLLPEKYPVEPHLYYSPRRQLNVLGLRGSRELIEDVGLGPSPESLALAHRAGLAVVGRLNSYPSLSERAIDAMLQDLRRKGIKTALFARDEVAGYKDLLEVTAGAMTKHQVSFASIEFAKQRGDAELTRRLKSRTVRVHSITLVEANALLPAEAVERFTRAVRERNVRLCYVRLLPQLKNDPVAESLAYVHFLATSVRRSGFQLGQARPFEDFHGAKLLLIINALGVLASMLWLLDELVTLPAEWLVGLLLGGLIGLCGGMAVATTLVVKVMAFAAACVYPALGYCLSGIDGGLRADRRAEGPNAKGGALQWSLVCFLRSSVATLMGAIMIVGLLSDVRFMVKADQFIGIKVSQILPLLIVIFVMITGVLSTRGNTSQERWRHAREEFGKFLKQPILVSVALMGIVGLTFAALWLARSGNEPGVGVSETELRVRALLERILIARPRTKEFLIGHPALLLGALFAWKGQRSWAVPLILLGIVGQASMLNTFCHIHTPLSLSLLRTFNGLWVGIAIGIVIWCLANRLARSPSDSESPESPHR